MKVRQKFILKGTALGAGAVLLAVLAVFLFVVFFGLGAAIIGALVYGANYFAALAFHSLPMMTAKQAFFIGGAANFARMVLKSLFN